MKNPPTLIDAVIGFTYGPTFRGYDRGGWLRKHLIEARRFSLDETMSTFMADLAHTSINAASAKRAPSIIDGMRTLSRLPHKVTWIEYDLQARMKRSIALNKKKNSSITQDLIPSEAPAKSGWLLVQHPDIETAFMCSEIVAQAWDPKLNRLIDEVGVGPFCFTWRSDDGPSPWRVDPIFDRVLREIESPVPLSYPEVLTGTLGYKCDSVVPVFAPWFDMRLFGHVRKGDETEADKVMVRAITSWLGEFAVSARYLWSLLSTINDIPVTYEQVRPTKGYVARGQYRKFIEHTVIRLKIPGRMDLQTLAGRVSRAARRRAHMVRGHWRKDRWHPGEKLWITEHQRGDASLGFVTHDYTVEH